METLLRKTSIRARWRHWNKAEWSDCTIKKVSVLQSPSIPEYPTEPRRKYNIALTLLVGLLIAGTKLLEDIVLDHVD